MKMRFGALLFLLVGSLPTPAQTALLTYQGLLNSVGGGTS